MRSDPPLGRWASTAFPSGERSLTLIFFKKNKINKMLLFILDLALLLKKKVSFHTFTVS